MNEIEKMIEALHSERLAAEVKRMEAAVIAQQWADKMEGISRQIERLKRTGTQPEGAEMNRLISSDSPKSLIDAYMNDATFHAVVTQHEIQGSSYTVMLESAVDELVKRDKAVTSRLLEYAHRFGPLNSDQP